MKSAEQLEQIRFSIDRGGTFTDIYAEYGNKQVAILKLLSEDPQNYNDAPLEGIRRILQKIKGFPIDKQNKSCDIDWVRMGTTLATNALLERSGEKVAFLTTKGFADILQIGYQNRPDIFDLQIKKPSLLYDSVIEVEERLRPARDGDAGPFLHGNTGDLYTVIKKVNTEKILLELEKLRQNGTTSVAIAFLHAYACPFHEKVVGKIAQDLGFKQISLSSETMPMIKIVPRGDTTVIDAYLTPLIKKYVRTFQEGFAPLLPDNRLLFMQSDGGLSPADGFKGSNAILSGPAGGVVGYALTTYSQNKRQPVIGFDMGGTSTDVSRYDGEFDIVHEANTAGVSLQAPQLQINTVAAGGGSRLFFENRMFKVGPQSAGSHPGPLCYRKNGYLTITDANIVLGRLHADFFPNIFGASADMPLDSAASREGFAQIAKEINKSYGKTDTDLLSIEEIAAGFLTVANQTMVKAISEISVMRGFNSKEHILASFGGAGGQHACAIARMLGIEEVFIHRFSGILSAYGMGLADVVIEKQIPASLTYSENSRQKISQKLDALSQEARDGLLAQGHHVQQISIQRYLHLRYKGTNTAFMIREPDDADFLNSFRKRHLREFGFDLCHRPILVDNIRIRASSTANIMDRTEIVPWQDLPPVKIKAHRPCYFDHDWQQTPIYLLEELGAGFQLSGPAILINDTSTILLEPDTGLRITKFGDVKITVATRTASLNQAVKFDPVQLSIFSNLFISVAEQMGRTLQKTALSTNIKERLDFSCAIFDKEGNLVANAPHIPVHLGSMGCAVKEQIKRQSNLRQGDVLLSNHPKAGGSHLPDITVITPVWHNGEIILFTAARGHHADIGGMTPGSMPPFSRCLRDEGAAIHSFKLVKEGVFQERGIRQLLQESRKIEDNIADLKAQIAANKKGIDLLLEIIRTSSIETVLAYMGYIQDCASLSVRKLLKKFAEEKDQKNRPLHAFDKMDDGTIISLKIRINPKDGSAIFDFSGTGPQVPGNWNTPEAVVDSAIIYSLRTLLETDLPLNQGCLEPITTIIPPGCLFSPGEEAAVVGGNVLTSQRIVDVIFKAFQAVSASQGCMNNLTFGNTNFGYYETIGGGAGAGPSWHGQSGVHTHMTNTRATDPEILERRFPVMIRQFSLRKNSGGKGLFNGGDGLVREIEALAEIDGAILSGRRVFQPYGLAGGQCGKAGKNILIRKDNTTRDLGGKNQVRLSPGDRILIKTPGGGGFGQNSH